MELILKNNFSTSIVNTPAFSRVSERLPEIDKQTRIFDRNNSQTTLSMISLTMLNGRSPFRLLRQILAEIERRKMALAEAQHSHAKLISEIECLTNKDRDKVEEAELRMKHVSLDMLESKINGSFKDIATLIDAYDNIKTKHKIDEWDEVVFEKEEKKHHIRRGFELLYRNMIDRGRPGESAIEYLQQFGVHPQIAAAEVNGYIMYMDQKIRTGEKISSITLENFLDEMSAKYLFCADEASENLFGKSDFTNKDYMLRLEKKE